MIYFISILFIIVICCYLDLGFSRCFLTNGQIWLVTKQKMSLPQLRLECNPFIQSSKASEFGVGTRNHSVIEAASGLLCNVCRVNFTQHGLHCIFCAMSIVHWLEKCHARYIPEHMQRSRAMYNPRGDTCSEIVKNNKKSIVYYRTVYAT